MAKFFKNYDRINLQIFNDVIEKLSDDELREINIQPKYLGMCSIKFCDFCPNDEDLNTSSDEISLLLGYQICKNCKNKNIGATFIQKWCVENKKIKMEDFISNLPNDHLFVNDDTEYRIQRSDDSFEDNWLLDKFELAQYIIKDDGTEDVRIPMNRESKSRRHLHKFVFCSELCRFNTDLNETELIKIFKSILNI